MLNGARFWESQAAATQARMLDVDPFKRIMFRLLMPAAYRLADQRLRRERPGIALSRQPRLPDSSWRVAIKASLGLSRARICYSTEAILSPDALRFYHALGLPLKSLYGTTEGGPLRARGKTPSHFDSVGPPFGGTEMRVADDGEIVYRTPAVFRGYYNDPEQTASVLRDGWFHSGDSCDVADGEIRFIDRTGSLVRMASGDTLAPQLVESRLRSSPYIKDAWVLAAPDGKYASAIVVINFTTVARWAGKRSTAFSTFAELSQKPDVYDLIMRDIERINSALPAGCRVRKFVNFHKEFDAGCGGIDEDQELETACARRTIPWARRSDLCRTDGSIGRRSRGASGRTHGNEELLRGHRLRGGRDVVTFFLQLVVTGLSLGMIYALVAIGFVIIVKCSNAFNIAQGHFVLDRRVPGLYLPRPLSSSPVGCPHPGR